MQRTAKQTQEPNTQNDGIVAFKWVQGKNTTQSPPHPHSQPRSTQPQPHTIARRSQNPTPASRRSMPALPSTRPQQNTTKSPPTTQLLPRTHKMLTKSNTANTTPQKLCLPSSKNTTTGDNSQRDGLVRQGLFKCLGLVKDLKNQQEEQHQKQLTADLLEKFNPQRVLDFGHFTSTLVLVGDTKKPLQQKQPATLQRLSSTCSSIATELDTHLECLQREVSSRDEELRDCKQQLVSLTAKLEAVTVENERNLQRLSSTTESQVSHQTEVDTTMTVSDQLQQLTQENAEIKRSLNVATRRLLSEQQSHNATKNTLALLVAKGKDESTQPKEEQKMLAFLQSRVFDLEKNLAVSTKQYEQSLQNLQDQLNHQKMACAFYANEVETLRQVISEKEEQLDTAITASHSLQAALQLETARVMQAEKRASSPCAQCKILESQLDTAAKALTQTQTQLHTLESKYQMSQCDLTEAQKKLQETVVQLHESQSHVRELLAEATCTPTPSTMGEESASSDIGDVHASHASIDQVLSPQSQQQLPQPQFQYVHSQPTQHQQSAQPKPEPQQPQQPQHLPQSQPQQPQKPQPQTQQTQTQQPQTQTQTQTQQPQHQATIQQSPEQPQQQPNTNEAEFTTKFPMLKIQRVRALEVRSKSCSFAQRVSLASLSDSHESDSEGESSVDEMQQARSNPQFALEENPLVTLLGLLPSQLNQFVKSIDREGASSPPLSLSSPFQSPVQSPIRSPPQSQPLSQNPSPSPSPSPSPYPSPARTLTPNSMRSANGVMEERRRSRVPLGSLEELVRSNDHFTKMISNRSSLGV